MKVLPPYILPKVRVLFLGTGETVLYMVSESKDNTASIRVTTKIRIPIRTRLDVIAPV